jgi:dCMP deaminase
MRPSWDEYFVEIARQVATRSTCLRRQVGAVIVRDRRILTTGYNGPPSGVSHCDIAGCLREELGIPSGQRLDICRALHAEQNSIIQAALRGVSTQGAMIYVTHQPCFTCAKMIINAGIVRIMYADGYPDEMACQVLSEAGVSLESWSQQV